MGLTNILEAVGKAQGLEPADATKYTGRLLDDYNYGRPLSTPLDFKDYVQAYKSWVYTAANRNAITVAQVPLRLFVTKRTRSKSLSTKAVSRQMRNFLDSNPAIYSLECYRKAVEVEEVIEHDFLNLMKRVNNFMNRFYLWEYKQLSEELTGNAYWYIVKNKLNLPAEIWPVQPQNMRVVPDKQDFIKGYVYEVGSRKIPFEESEIIHFKMPCPTSLYYGIGPLAAVSRAYNINEHMHIYEEKLLENQARPEGVLETDEGLNPQQFDRLKDEWKQTYGGSSNAGKTALLEKGVHYKPITLAPRDLNFLVGHKVPKAEILNAFGQSEGMYSESATRANAEAAAYTYMRDAIKPRLTRTEEKLNEKVVPMYGDDLFVAFDDCVPADQDFRLNEIKAHLETGYADVNEERQEDGREEVEWGNGPILPMNMVPFGTEASPEQIEEFGGKVAAIIREKLKHGN